MSTFRNRREFLALAGAAGTAGALALTGCGAGTGSGSAADGKGEPRRGGQFRALFTGGGEQETIDPHAEALAIDMARTKAMFDRLVDLDATMAPVPRLAEKWESNPEATVWRFTLREALFHDGKKLTPEDVLFSFGRILDPKATNHFAQGLLSVIDLKKSRGVGKNTVEIVLNRPSAELPALLGTLGTAIVSARYLDPAKPVGTGAFRLKTFQAGRSFVAERFDDHWDGGAYVDELRILSADADARGNALRGGEAEYGYEMTPTFARTAQADKSVRIIAAKGSTAHAIVMKCDQEPFDNPDVTLAFKLLADREKLVEVVLAGRGVVGNDMFGKGYQYYPVDIPQRTRDVAEARALLKKAGVLNKPLSIYTSSVANGFVEAATLFAEQAADAGLRVKVTTGSSETYFKDQLTKGVMGSHRSGAMTIPTYINDRLLTKSAFNASGWRRKDFDAAFAKAQSTTDEAERTRLYGDLQRTVHEEGGLLMWGHPDWLNAVSSRVRGVEEAPPNTLDSARFDKVWLA
ncbi:ABC transporter substrate-binding protein [Streptomyces sp. CB03238]|uniref:ABC transporter substrate-binding protein n=1 Tax=Streptomyces sp. CB03238 TaxID=1907777 RepID=UPI000A1147EB|nr:ABC transporter substrate-binding protein [Streptomyces sp. CB03238]ORT57230.1 peptide ABC transporter substrate-binding protein [Streptomyces sp. CB03238]